MGIDKVLARLEGVKKNGHGRYLARCPAHKDRSPSLSVKETDTGLILVHCFAGCSVDDVIGAIGLDQSDLFPPRPETHAVKGERQFDAYQALRALADDAVLILVAARMVIKGERLIPSDMDRLSRSVANFQAAKSFVLGGVR